MLTEWCSTASQAYGSSVAYFPSLMDLWPRPPFLMAYWLA